MCLHVLSVCLVCTCRCIAAFVGICVYLSPWDKQDFSWGLAKALWCLCPKTHTHLDTHTSPFSQRWTQVAKSLWRTASLLMTPLAIQVCVGWPVCLHQRRHFLSELCQPEEHRWSPGLPHPLPSRVLPHLHDTTLLQMWELGSNPRMEGLLKGVMHWRGRGYRLV